MRDENKKYYEVLSKDPLLRPLLEHIVPRRLVRKQNLCVRLCASIMSQQLSTKVADVIFKRFLTIYDGNEPSAQEILETAPETLREIGLSNAKVLYVLNVARYFIENGITDATFDELNNEAIVAMLTSIKGVGKWTVEMLLMFALLREDVFAVDDLGIQQAMARIYNLDVTDKKALRARMLEISAAWAPYRTWACIYLWDSKDKKTTE